MLTLRIPSDGVEKILTILLALVPVLNLISQTLIIVRSVHKGKVLLCVV